MSTSVLSPVSAAVYSVLTGDATLTGLATGGVFDVVPQPTAFPFVLFEVRDRETRGFGTGSLPEVELRVHAYSTSESMKEAQDIVSRIVTLLKDASLTIAGWAQCGLVFWDETVSLGDTLINGVECHELVAMFRIYAEA